jgi:glycosyltransferase involved in cell wall biosynthesis
MSSLLSLNSFHYRRGGSETVYFNHAALFAERGWRTTFFSMRHPENLPCEQEDFFADCIDYEGAAGSKRSIGNALKIIYSQEARDKLSRMLDLYPADVAHVHSIYHHLSPSVLMELKSRGVPIVMTAHDLKLACPNNKMLNRQGVCERCKGGKVWNVVLNRCIKDSVLASGVIAVESAIHKSLDLYGRYLDRIIAPSQFYRTKLIEWGWSPDSITYIPNFIEAPTDTSPSPTGDHVLYFGRLAPEKGLRTLVRAAAKSRVIVRMAGRGPEEAELRRLAAELDAPVTFLGHLSGQALWDEVGAARAVVLPSEWYENGPMSVIEAFARGRPLIGARIGGIPELIVEGQTGWTFEAANVEDLAARLAQVRSAPTSALAAMAEATRVFARNNHSRETYFEAVSALYREIGVENMHFNRSRIEQVT